MKTLLISLISDQTLPNVRLIKEMKDTVSDYLFISTKGMESKGCRKWVENATEIIGLPPIIVEQFSFEDITNKLNEVDFSSYAKLIVNLTGGTKVMTIVTYDYLKNIGAEIYYITGFNNEYIKVFPNSEKQIIKFKTSITLKEYLLSYGFDITLSETSEKSEKSYEYTCNFLEIYCKNIVDEEKEAFSLLRKKRNRGIKDADYKEVESLIRKINFNSDKEGELSSSEVKYLTGGWFEEYVGETIRRELSLNNDNIFIGAKLQKELPLEKNNPIEELLGSVKQTSGPNNEFDVIFLYMDSFYVIECKTSIIDTRNVEGKDGTPILKDFNILGETIYKSEALKSKFGLFAKSYIFTLTDFKQYANSDRSKISQMEELINRATLGGIKIRGREQIIANINNIKSLL